MAKLRRSVRGQVLEAKWLAGLNKGLKDPGVTKPLPKPDFPFYGDKLQELTDAADKANPDLIPRSGQVEADDQLVADILRRMAERGGIDPNKAFADDAELLERGPGNWEWVQAIARQLEQAFPWLADGVLKRFIRDVRVYMDFVHVQTAVHKIVETELTEEPTVIIAHSLGSIVGYNVLSTADPNTVSVPLFLTVGSPLGIETIRRRQPKPLGVPAAVDDWLNISDEKDLVSLYTNLSDAFGTSEIEDWNDLDNGDDPHGIAAYLSHAKVAKRIADAF